jgi:hypothetical protein
LRLPAQRRQITVTIRRQARDLDPHIRQEDAAFSAFQLQSQVVVDVTFDLIVFGADAAHIKDFAVPVLQPSF